MGIHNTIILNWYLDKYWIWIWIWIWISPSTHTLTISEFFLWIPFSQSSMCQVVGVGVAVDVDVVGEVLTSRGLQHRSIRPEAEKSAQSWRRASRSWNSARSSRSSSSCRVVAWRNSVPRTNRLLETLRSQVLDEVVKRRVRWGRDSEEDAEGDDDVRWWVPWGTGSLLHYRPQPP